MDRNKSEMNLKLNQGKLLGGAIYPHPPVLLREIGQGRENQAPKTLEGIQKLSALIAQHKPDIIVVVSPHGNYFADAMSILSNPLLEGDFSQFGAGDLAFGFSNNLEFVHQLQIKAKEIEVPLLAIDEVMVKQLRQGLTDQLDHGALVPLYFIQKELQHFQVVSITYGNLPPESLRRFGQAIRQTMESLGLQGILLASGDLSHKLSNQGPYSFAPEGPVFDKEIVELVEGGDLQGILSLDQSLARGAGECGLKSFQVLAGALEGLKLDSEVFSYEGPFGVGYMTAFLENMGEIQEPVDREEEDPLVALARASLEYYILHDEALPQPKELPKELLNTQGACFVSIKKYGELRGCIGTIFPDKENLATEIIYNAISSGAYDPRFHPVEIEELPELVYSVDVLTSPEPVRDPSQLDPKKYGVIVKQGNKRGVLLPDLQGIDRVQDQLDIACKKAGIFSGDYEIERFEVVRHQ